MFTYVVVQWPSCSFDIIGSATAFELTGRVLLAEIRQTCETYIRTALKHMTRGIPKQFQLMAEMYPLPNTQFAFSFVREFQN